jgi:hypothetical protein
VDTPVINATHNGIGARTALGSTGGANVKSYFPTSKFGELFEKLKLPFASVVVVPTTIILCLLGGPLMKWYESVTLAPTTGVVPAKLESPDIDKMKSASMATKKAARI